VVDEALAQRLLVDGGGPLEIGERLQLRDRVVGGQHRLGAALDLGRVAELGRVVDVQQVLADEVFGGGGVGGRRHRPAT
jgi:hypothetical protein